MSGIYTAVAEGYCIKCGSIPAYSISEMKYEKKYYKVSFDGHKYIEEALNITTYFEDMPIGEEIRIEKIKMTEEEFNKLKTD